jgi:hypothetical protein
MAKQNNMKYRGMKEVREGGRNGLREREDGEKRERVIYAYWLWVLHHVTGLI